MRGDAIPKVMEEGCAGCGTCHDGPSLTGVFAARNPLRKLRKCPGRSALRNDIVHSGVSALSQHDQRMVCDEVQDIAREYLLRRLGYRGSYAEYSDVNGWYQVLPMMRHTPMAGYRRGALGELGPTYISAGSVCEPV